MKFVDVGSLESEKEVENEFTNTVKQMNSYLLWGTTLVGTGSPGHI